MTELELYQEILKLSIISEQIGCQPISEELLTTADYLKEFIDESTNYKNKLI